MNAATLLTMAAALTLSSSHAFAAKPVAADVMKKVEDRKLPDNSKSRVEMTIKKGDSKVEKIFKIMSLKVSPEETHSLIEFEKPGNTKILAYMRKTGEDDRWIKTSSGQAKRISASAEDQTFAQSHFSYADLQFAKASDFSHEAVCEGEKCEFDFQGAPHYKIKSTPKKASSLYSYLVNYVRVADSMPAKAEYFGKDGKLFKELSVDEFKDVAGFQTPVSITMKELASGDFTNMKVTSVEHNTKDITKRMFDKSVL